jgi:hypothetical protein
MTFDQFKNAKDKLSKVFDLASYLCEWANLDRQDEADVWTICNATKTQLAILEKQISTTVPNAEEIRRDVMVTANANWKILKNIEKQSKFDNYNRHV